MNTGRQNLFRLEMAVAIAGLMAALAMIGCPAEAKAQWADGHVSNGYTWQAGVGAWHKDGVYYKPSYYNGKTYYDVFSAKGGQSLQDKALALAKYAQEHKQFLETLDALGLKGAYAGYHRGDVRTIVGASPLLNPYLQKHSTLYADTQSFEGVKELRLSSFGDNFDQNAAVEQFTKLAIAGFDGGREVGVEATRFAGQVQEGIALTNQGVLQVAQAQAAANQTDANARLLEANSRVLNAGKPKDSLELSIRQSAEVQAGEAAGDAQADASPERPSRVVVDLTDQGDSASPRSWTLSRDKAPVFAKFCGTCHVAGGGAAAAKFNPDNFDSDGADLARMAAFKLPGVKAMPPAGSDQPSASDLKELLREISRARP